MNQMYLVMEDSIEKMAYLNRKMAHLYEHFYRTLPLVEEELKMATQELQILIQYFLNSNPKTPQQIYSVVDHIFLNLTDALVRYRDNQGLVREISNLCPDQGVESYQHQIQRQLRHVSEILQGVLVNISQALQPIQKIMERVQVQDIYQQTLEKMMEILAALQVEYEQSRFQGDLAFFQQGVEQVHQTFLQNQERMQGSLDALAEDFTEISVTVQSVLQDSVYLRYFLVGEREGEPVLEKILAQIYQVVDLFDQMTVDTQPKAVGQQESRQRSCELEVWVPRVRRQLEVVEQFLSEAIHNITYSIEQLHIEVESVFERLKESDHGELVQEIDHSLAKLSTYVSQISLAPDQVQAGSEGKERLETMLARLQSSLRWGLARDGRKGQLEMDSTGGELTLF